LLLNAGRRDLSISQDAGIATCRQGAAWGWRRGAGLPGRGMATQALQRAMRRQTPRRCRSLRYHTRKDVSPSWYDAVFYNAYRFHCTLSPYAMAPLASLPRLSAATPLSLGAILLFPFSLVQTPLADATTLCCFPPRRCTAADTTLFRAGRKQTWRGHANHFLQASPVPPWPVPAACAHHLPRFVATQQQHKEQ